jgi:hypothetical protein
MAGLDILPCAFHTYETQTTHKGMAYFANTGPLGSKCNDCAEYMGRCKAFARMTGKMGPTFPGDTGACKYFTDKASPGKAKKEKPAMLFEDLPRQKRSS